MRDAWLTQSGKSFVDRNSEARRSIAGDCRAKQARGRKWPEAVTRADGDDPWKGQSPREHPASGRANHPARIARDLWQAGPGSRSFGHDLADFGRSGRAKGNGKRGERRR